MERRVFVLTSEGERGPFTVDDLKRELQAGAVQRSDQLRTALGKTVGTVGDMVGPGVSARPSGRMPAAYPGSISGSRSRQPSSTNLRPIDQSANEVSDRIPLRTGHTKHTPSLTQHFPVVLVLVLMALFIGLWWLSRSNAAGG